MRAAFGCASAAFVRYYRSMHRVPGNITLWLLLVLAGGSSVVVGGVLSAVEIFAPPGYLVSLSDDPASGAAAWIAFDAVTGEIFIESNADTALPIASVTKLSTAAVAYRTHDIWATTTVLSQDVAATGRAGKLVEGAVYDFHTLLFPLLLESSNDAASVFARTLPSLVRDMNAYAASLGLEHTRFADTSGLADGNRSTASDLARMLKDIYQEHRHVIDITGLPAYLSPTTGWINNSPLAALPGYVGGKHGYTPLAKHTAVAIFKEELGDTERSVGYVILGSDDLAADITALREYVTTHVSFKEHFLVY